MISFTRKTQKAPLCKGGWQKSLIFDWGIVMFLPLHKGGFPLGWDWASAQLAAFFNQRKDGSHRLPSLVFI